MDSTDSSAVDLSKFRIPDSLFRASVSQELAVSIGLVAMLGALAEHKIENLWIELKGPAAAKKGPSPNVSQNIKDCRKILAFFATGNDEDEPHTYEWHYQAKAAKLLEEAEKALEARNELVHRVWSKPDAVRPSGYKTPTPGKRVEADKLARPYREVSVEEIRSAIGQLVEVVGKFDLFGGSSPGSLRPE